MDPGTPSSTDSIWKEPVNARLECDADVVVDAHCIMCGYHLRGLKSGGACPECSAPIARSLYPGALDYMSAIEAAALARGVSDLRWAMWIVFANVIGLPLAALLGSIMLLLALSLLAAVAQWLEGWHEIASVRADGAGRGNEVARALTRLATYAQTIGTVVLIVSVFSSQVRAAAASFLVFAPLAPLLMTSIGQWRLLSLARRGGDGPLTRRAASAAVMVGMTLTLTIAAIVTAAFSDTFAVSIGLFAGIAGLIAIVLWHSFLGMMGEKARRRAEGPP